MGLNDSIITINDDVLKFIIEEYTCEAGVRKLKELLFEIISEVNLEFLKNSQNELLTLPVIIDNNNIKNNYLKERNQINQKLINIESKIGTINGMWANSLGMGGIIKIQTYFMPSNSFFDLKLTGAQGDIMKESMNVALTLAWNLTSQEIKDKLLNDKSKNCGIHIHCPENSTPKDGPSAGAAITCAIYSLFNSLVIRNNISITGEICLNGNVTIIGGLDLKILGAIKAGVTEIIYPRENEKDFKNFMDKYSKNISPNIKFYSVSSINEIIQILFT